MRAPARSASLPPGMTTRRSAILLLLGGALPALAGCGFSPLYGRGEDGSVAEELAKIRVLPIANRSGQVLRNHLLDGLTPRGEPQKPQYTLQVVVEEANPQALSITRNDTTVRYGYSANARYRLLAEDGQDLLQSRTSGSSTYLASSSQFATVSSHTNARERVMEEMAKEIQAQVAAFLRAQRAAARKPQ